MGTLDVLRALNAYVHRKDLYETYVNEDGHTCVRLRERTTAIDALIPTGSDDVVKSLRAAGPLTAEVYTAVRAKILPALWHAKYGVHPPRMAPVSPMRLLVEGALGGGPEAYAALSTNTEELAALLCMFHYVVAIGGDGRPPTVDSERGPWRVTAGRAQLATARWAVLSSALNAAWAHQETAWCGKWFQRIVAAMAPPRLASVPPEALHEWWALSAAADALRIHALEWCIGRALGLISPPLSPLGSPQTLWETVGTNPGNDDDRMWQHYEQHMRQEEAVYLDVQWATLPSGYPRPNTEECDVPIGYGQHKRAVAGHAYARLCAMRSAKP